MATVKRIVCLANSRKSRQRCIAGVEILNDVPQGWIRPVSDRKDQEVSSSERRYQGGGEPELLDIMDVSLLEYRPKDYQQENWLLDSKKRWSKIDVFEWNDLYKIAEVDSALWSNGYHPNNDRIPVDQAKKEINSLKLIHVDQLRLQSIEYPDFDKRKRIRGYFKFADKGYALRVTDPHVEQRCRMQEGRDYRLGECFLTISFGEAYGGYCYKLIAAVMEKPQ